jgi:hypothetical protein
VNVVNLRRLEGVSVARICGPNSFGREQVGEALALRQRSLDRVRRCREKTRPLRPKGQRAARGFRAKRSKFSKRITTMFLGDHQQSVNVVNVCERLKNATFITYRCESKERVNVVNVVPKSFASGARRLPN